MNQICEKIFDTTYFCPTCVKWLKAAAHHCVEVGYGKETMWRKVKEFFTLNDAFAPQTGILSIDVMPEEMSKTECYTFLEFMITEERLRYEKHDKNMSWNVWLLTIWKFELLMLIVLIGMIVGLRYMKRKYSDRFRIVSLKEILFTPELCKQAFLKRNVSMLKYEMKHLHVPYPYIRPGLHLPRDVSPVLILRITSKLKLQEDIITSISKATGALYRRVNENQQGDFKQETLQKTNDMLISDLSILQALCYFENPYAN